jgi:hypothetical protein
VRIQADRQQCAARPHNAAGFSEKRVGVLKVMQRVDAEEAVEAGRAPGQRAASPLRCRSGSSPTVDRTRRQLCRNRLGLSSIIVTDKP